MRRRYLPAPALARRSAAVGAALVAITVAGGCGADGDPAPAADRPAEPAEPAAASGPGAEAVTAYRSWLSALADRDAEPACARHAPDFTIALRQRAILQHRAALGDPCTDFVAILWEDPATETAPADVEVTQLTGEDALLAVDFPEVDRTVRMVARHGGWYVASSVPRGSGSAAWVDAWCTLVVGMDRDAVIGLMGEPSGEYTVDDGGEPQLWWARAPYDFRAYLEPDGTVAELVGDYDALGQADRDRLPCPELRNSTNR